MVKLPTAPANVAGGFGGNGFTSNVTGSPEAVIRSCWLRLPNGSRKNGSDRNGSSRLKISNGKRLRELPWRRGTATTALVRTGPISNLPGLVAAIAVLKLNTSYCLPLIVCCWG